MFSLVIVVVLGNRVPNFPVYLFSGLVAWNLFSTSLSLGARSVVDNAGLVTKVYFPRELLPLASVGTAGVDFVLQGGVLVLFMLATRAFVVGWNLLLLPLAMVALLLLTSAINLWIAALNVRYRDTQHIINIVIMTWFWLTPVVYPDWQAWKIFQPSHHHPVALKFLYLANPMTDIVFGFQRALYARVSPTVCTDVVDKLRRTHLVCAPQNVLATVSVAWIALLLACVTGGCLLMFLAAWRTFFRLSGDFAEEL